MMWLWLGLGLLIVILLIILVALIWRCLTSSLSHWQRKGVPTLAGAKPVVGSIWRVMTMKEHMVIFFKRVYEEFDGKPYVGFYQGNTPALLIRDPGVIKHILVKDFTHFTDRGFKFHEESGPLESKNLFNLGGQKWRDMRNILSPTFTSGKMKAMFPLVLERAEELENFILGLVKSGEEFEMKDLTSKYTMNVIGSCVFGVKTNSMENPNNEFREMVKKLLANTLWKGVKMFVMFFLPKISIMLRLSFFGEEITNYFRKLVRDIIEHRARTGETRRDFMQLLIELKDKGQTSLEEGETPFDEANTISLINLTEDDMAAQAMIFFLAGYDTSATTLTFALLELAVSTDLQRRVQYEIDEVLENHDNKITYEAIQDMHYLDCVLQESMRKYPPAPLILRICTENYIIPETEVTIEEGTPIVIPSLALNNDPKYFPSPERFDPDRFVKDGTNENNKFVFMPFGEGPRQCIGNRFALLQSRLGLLAVLRKYDVHFCSRTNYPVVFSLQEMSLVNQGGTWLKATLRTEK